MSIANGEDSIGLWIGSTVHVRQYSIMGLTNVLSRDQGATRLASTVKKGSEYNMVQGRTWSLGG